MTIELEEQRLRGFAPQPGDRAVSLPMRLPEPVHHGVSTAETAERTYPDYCERDHANE